MRLLKQIALVLALAALAATLPARAAGPSPPVLEASYSFVLADDDTAGSYILEVYLDSADHLVLTGSLGIRFPATVTGVSAAAAEGIELVRSSASPGNREYFLCTWGYRGDSRPSESGHMKLFTLTLTGRLDVAETLADNGFYLLNFSGAGVAESNFGGPGAWLHEGWDETLMTAFREGIWRYEAELSGWYYQGYYARAAGAGEREDELVQLPIGCPALPLFDGVFLAAYKPAEDIMLEIYRQNDDGTYSADPQRRVTLVYPDKTAVGRVLYQVDFSVIFDSATNPVPLEDGVYKLVFSKSAHVSLTCLGLTASEGAVFTEFAGATYALPCGDVNGDGAVRQTDRAELTRPEAYGKTVPGADAADHNDRYLLDLDGDGRADQRDLAILIDPANYGRTAVTVDLGAAEGSGA